MTNNVIKSTLKYQYGTIVKTLLVRESSQSNAKVEDPAHPGGTSIT